MTETTSTTAVVDEQARFRAFTALGLALAGLAGGGLLATAMQWLVLKTLDETGTDQFYFTGLAVGPLALGGAAMWLATGARSSGDELARPLARAAFVLSVVSVGSSVLLVAATFDSL
jgi:hypothetical protein